MIPEAIIFVIFTYITFTKMPSTALKVAWLFLAIGFVLTLLTSYAGPLLLVSMVGYILALVITAIVTQGDNY